MLKWQFQPSQRSSGWAETVFTPLFMRFWFLEYYYAKGAGNGALPPGRRQSSFTFRPDWRDHPWPPRNKYDHSATDEELGL